MTFFLSQVDGVCMRISSYPKNLTDAMTICENEGSVLLAITNRNVHNNLTALLAEKRKKFPHFSFVDFYWLGAKPIRQSSAWEWMYNPLSMEIFSNWKMSVKSM
jgi:hypothetical protein